jgi:hypothetical protein
MARLWTQKGRRQAPPLKGFRGTWDRTQIGELQDKYSSTTTMAAMTVVTIGNAMILVGYNE